MALGKRRWTLRVTILALMLLLLVTTVGVIGVAGYVTTRASLQALADQYVEGATRAVDRALHTDLVRPAEPMLLELRSLALRGLLPLDNLDLLGEYLVERLRYEPTLDWLYYGEEATGRFVATTRRDGQLVLTQSSPDVAEGRWRSETVDPSGGRAPVDLGVQGSYDPRERPWYHAAVGSTQVTWTEPYRFFDGQIGVTATLAVREPTTDALRGVFAADLWLDQVVQYLSSIVIGDTGRVIVLSRNGELIETLLPRGAERLGQVLAATLGQVPRSLATLGPDETLTANAA